MVKWWVSISHTSFGHWKWMVSCLRDSHLERSHERHEHDMTQRFPEAFLLIPNVMFRWVVDDPTQIGSNRLVLGKTTAVTGSNFELCPWVVVDFASHEVCPQNGVLHGQTTLVICLVPAPNGSLDHGGPQWRPLSAVVAIATARCQRARASRGIAQQQQTGATLGKLWDSHR